MAEVLTTAFKSDLTRDFFEDLQNNNFYAVVSSVSPDQTNRITAVNSYEAINQFKEKILFGKKIFSDDMKFMVKYYPWQKGQTYDQYDDKIDLTDKRFYAVVGPNNNDTGDYRVFKCLFNNNNESSETPPNYNAYAEGGIIKTADGYVWQYLYAISGSEFEAYNALGYIPIVGDFEINPDYSTQTGSQLGDIFVENPIDNAGYPHISGFLEGRTDDGEFTIRAETLSEISNYYAGMYIYTTNPSNSPDDPLVSRVFIIDSYYLDGSTGKGKVKVRNYPEGETIPGYLPPGIEDPGDPNPGQVFISPNANFSIVPRIEIKGDGEGAVAIPEIADGNIRSILVLNNGSGYTNITATIIDPLYDFDPDDPASIDLRAKLRPVLSPIGGHGFDLINELHCRHVLLYGYITETDNNNIGATNLFSHIGVIKNPEFKVDPAPDVFDNRIAVTTDNYKLLEVDKTVVQLDDNNIVTFSGRVHEIDEDANTVYISEYMGPYQNLTDEDTSFNITKNLVNELSQQVEINTPVEDNVVISDYVQKTGKVYFMEDFVPLERSKFSREEYKLVLEF